MAAVFLREVQFTNFRCFGPEPVRLEMPTSIGALVGTNGSGKTAALAGLQRMFGTSTEARRIRPTDFHVTPDEGTPEQRCLALEALFEFPELESDDVDHQAVPQFFKQLVVDDAGAMVARLQLRATWTADGSVDGEVRQDLYAVSTLSDDPSEDELHRVDPHDRSRVQVVYVPPARIATTHVTQFLRGRLWRAARWSDGLQHRVSTAAGDLNSALTDEAAVAAVTEALASRWGALHSAGTDTEPSFRAAPPELSELIGDVALYFEPAAAGVDRRADELSEGQQSLLQIAMTATALDIEAQLAAGALADAFDVDSMALPALTIVALEEPENSLSPFYLSRIVSQLESIASSGRAQAIVSSHSASVLRRIDPADVRYIRHNDGSRRSSIRRLTLPNALDEAEKYIREAVRAYPELYFARAVVLGEGDTEELILPALARARGVDVDQSFVAVVPLGGRHVDHMWALLHDLDIPYVTLLDLDTGRKGGGVGRLRTIVDKLIELEVTATTIAPDVDDPEAEIANLRADPDSVDVDAWLGRLRKLAVYYSAPLDLDWSMLTAFPVAYQHLGDEQHGPDASLPYNAVFGTGNGDGLEWADVELLRWYRYLFVTRGKPSTHLSALTRLSPEELATGTPEPLAALLDHVQTLIG